MRLFTTLHQMVVLSAPVLVMTACNNRQAVAETKTETQAQPTAAAGSSLPVDLSALRDNERASFFKLIGRLPSVCGKAHALEVSVKSDPSCRRSIYAMRYLAHLEGMHLLESEVEENYEKRFGENPVLKFDLTNAPLRGEPHAPITLVEFSDFQCPHCKHLQPILERVLDEYRGKVKLYFKNYPISRAHPDAETAAAAALAAGKQNRFWQFHDRVFATDQEHEDLPVLEKIAKDLKLDVKKWRGDIEPSRSQVQKDHAEGEAAKISSTPSLFINGRVYHGPHNYEELKDWIEEELNR